MTRQRTSAARFAYKMCIDYADTDAAGVVYYGNYAAYMERARNAGLRELGFSLTRLQQQHCILFAVTEAKLKYLSAARLDDEIELTTEIVQLNRVSLVFAQRAYRDNQLLVDGEIKLASLNSNTYTLCRMPSELADALQRWMHSK